MEFRRQTFATYIDDYTYMQAGDLIQGFSGTAVNEILELTPGLQCCLRCGRVLTDRALHDTLEEPVLASIRAARPGASSDDAECEPCIDDYRNLLNGRQARSVKLRESGPRRRTSLRPSFMSKWWAKRVEAAQTFEKA